MTQPRSLVILPLTVPMPYISPTSSRGIARLHVNIHQKINLANSMLGKTSEILSGLMKSSIPSATKIRFRPLTSASLLQIIPNHTLAPTSFFALSPNPSPSTPSSLTSLSIASFASPSLCLRFVYDIRSDVYVALRSDLLSLFRILEIGLAQPAHVCVHVCDQ